MFKPSPGQRRMETAARGMDPPHSRSWSGRRAVGRVLLLAVAFPVEVVAGGGKGKGNGYGNGNDNGNGYGYGNGNGGNLKPWEGSPKAKCATRCSNTQYKKACLTFCNKCCAKCLCVPPGFYGNKGACPCYNNWKTKEGGPKCP